MDKPMVSIVIPTYNRVKTIKKTIGSYIKQDFLKEVIIIDDNSEDETGDLIKSSKSAKIKYFKNKKRMGSPFSRNLGIELAKGDYILQSDDDVVLHKDYLKNLVLHMKENNCDIIAGRRINMIEGEGFEASLKRADKIKGVIFNPHSFYVNTDLNVGKDVRNPFLQATMLFRKTIYPKIKYDDYKGNAFREETGFQLSAARSGLKIFLCNHAISYHLPRSMSASGGQHDRSRINYEYWAIRNHIKFLKRHYLYLNKYFSYNRSYIIWVLDFLFYTFKRPFYKFKRALYKS